MRAICVSQDAALLEELLSRCRAAGRIGEARGFVRAEDALLWLAENSAELALFDLDRPEGSALPLAAESKRLRPRMALVLLSGSGDAAVEAFALRACGYLLKPLRPEALDAEIDYALSLAVPGLQERVMIHTFGNFDVFVDGEPLRFSAARSKELLAYLVDRQGCCVTRPELSAALWEERLYDRRMQKQLDVYIRKLLASLRACGVGEIVEMSRGTLRVRPETFRCDMYLFLNGDRDVIRQYRGEYMKDYSWASMMESRIAWNMGGEG